MAFFVNFVKLKCFVVLLDVILYVSYVMPDVLWCCMYFSSANAKKRLCPRRAKQNASHARVMRKREAALSADHLLRVVASAGCLLPLVCHSFTSRPSSPASCLKLSCFLPPVSRPLALFSLSSHLSLLASIPSCLSSRLSPLASCLSSAARISPFISHCSLSATSNASELCRL